MPHRRAAITGIAASALLAAGPSEAAPGGRTLSGSITDVPGLRVGHFTDSRRPTGCTVVLAEAGAEILLVPSCTDTPSGYHRVRSACAARALENQFYAIQSSTVGEAPWSAALDVNIGAAAVFAPPDRAISANGIVTEGPLNAPQWVYDDLDLDALARVREDGEVLNSKRWSMQPGAGTLPPAKVVVLD